MISLLFLPMLISIQDRQFALIQETWIYKNTDKPNSLNEVMSSRLANLVRDLGCNHYSCRENAEELILQQSNEDSVRALFWGSHHTDPEIADRCRFTLHHSMICSHCLGDGHCPERSKFNDWRGCQPCFNRMMFFGKEEVNQEWSSLREMYGEKVCLFCFGDGITPLESF